MIHRSVLPVSRITVNFRGGVPTWMSTRISRGRMNLIVSGNFARAFFAWVKKVRKERPKGPCRGSRFRARYEE